MSTQTNSVSRSPSDYRPDQNGHFRRRKSERDVPGPAIRECIENGDVVSDDGHDGIKLRAEWAGVQYWVALNPEEGVAVSCGVCG